MKCEKCEKEIDGSFGSGRFCSRSCANSKSHSYETKKKISESCSKIKHEYDENLYKEKECLQCNKLTKNPIFCSIKCKNQYTYEENIRKWKNSKFDGSKSGGNAISNFIRRYLFEKFDNKCPICGWCKKNTITNKIPLEVHHIDGKFKNNKEENLILLCPNCHSLTLNYGSLNEGNGAYERLKYFKLV